MESKNLKYRPITKEDTDMVLAWRNSDHVKNNFLYRKDISKEEHYEWLDTKVATGKVIQFIFSEKDSNKPIGSVYLKSVDYEAGNAEYGIFIGDTNAIGKGYGTETAMRMIEYAFDELHLKSLYLRVLARNSSAIRSYSKAGFQLIEGREMEINIEDRPEKVIFMEVKAL